jgi:NTE family protein
MPAVATARRADGMRVGRIAAVAALGALSLAGCASPRAFEGEALSAQAAVAGKADGYRAAAALARRSPDGLRVVVSLSGGGMRASALAYGVLEQLAADEVRAPSQGAPRRLLDEVDLISAVSGGAVPAAYFALHGDRVFEDFERRFLKRDVSGSLQRALFLDPRNWIRLASANWSRGDVYAEWLDRKLFRGATYGDLDRTGDRPFLLLNATDIGLAARFEFTQDTFDLLCGDLDRYPVGQAVAASSSVPALLTPITLRNRAGGCVNRRPAWVDAAARSGDDDLRRGLQASAMRAYADASRYPWLHLVDGALGDNLGVRAALDALADRDEPTRPGASVRVPGQRLVFIAVNASDAHASRIGARREPPDAFEMLRLLGTVPVDRYTAETKALLHETLRRWMPASEAALLHVIEIDLDDLRDDARYGRLVLLPTAFDAPDRDIDALRCAASELLAAAPEYRRLLAEAGGGVPTRSSRCPSS